MNLQHHPINFGDTLTCAETGRQFIAAADGITTNYARNAAGDVFSDDLIDAYIELKMADVYAMEHTPHPIEFVNYYSV